MAVAKRVDLFSKFLWNFNLVWEATGLGRLLWPHFPLWHILLHFSAGSAGASWSAATDGVSLGSAGCAVMTSAGPWPCALGSAFPLFAPLITWRGTVACCLLCYREELLLRALCLLLQCVFPLNCWVLIGAGPGLVHHLLAGGNTQGSGILPVSSFLYRRGVEEKGGEGKGCGSGKGIVSSHRGAV